MGLFQSNNPKEKPRSGVLGAFSSEVIKWEPETSSENQVIVHKYEYEDFVDGSYLIVGPSQMAVFINNLDSGSSINADTSHHTQVSTFVGPDKIKLTTGDSRFAPFRNTAHALTGGESAFHSTVYFINTCYMNELRWGTQEPIYVEDPQEHINVHVRAFGLFGTHIEKMDETKAAICARRFLEKVVGTQANYTQDQLTSFMRAKILEEVPNLLAQKMIQDKIGALQISAYLEEFSEAIYTKLIGGFEDFGLSLDHFSFTNINVPDRDLALLNEAKIEKEVRIKEAQATSVSMDLESEAMARKRAREGYTYQQEQAFGVMDNAASNEGSASNIMGAGMGLGMGFGVGGAMKDGMRGVIDNSFASVDMTNVNNSNQAVDIICPSCSAPVPSNFKFCPQCGEKIEAKKGCPSCGAEIIEGAKFCHECGYKFEQDKYCPSCGRKVDATTKFCPDCGTKIL